jgi:DNA-binding FadR family transcriptional regulator
LESRRPPDGWRVVVSKLEAPEPEEAAEPRRSLPETVADRIQAKILDGTFRAGDRLPPERDLAEQLQVNRSSLREALKKLQQLRLITIQQGSGITVRRPDEASFDLVWSLLFPQGRPDLPRIRDFLELREALMPGILRLAVQRASPGEIQDAISAIDRAAGPELSDKEFADTLRELGDALARMSGNKVLMLLSNSLRHFMAQRGFQDALLGLARKRLPVISLMRRLGVALQARDVASAERTYSELLRLSTSEILSGLEAQEHLL